MRYYIADESQENGFIEVTEVEYNALFGDETIRPYVQSVYRREIMIEDVPVEYQEAVQIVIDNRVQRWGLYEEVVEDYPEICG